MIADGLFDDQRTVVIPKWGRRQHLRHSIPGLALHSMASAYPDRGLEAARSECTG